MVLLLRNMPHPRSLMLLKRTKFTSLCLEVLIYQQPYNSKFFSLVHELNNGLGLLGIVVRLPYVLTSKCHHMQFLLTRQITSLTLVKLTQLLCKFGYTKNNPINFLHLKSVGNLERIFVQNCFLQRDDTSFLMSA